MSFLKRNKEVIKKPPPKALRGEERKMTICIPYNIGEEIVIDGEKHIIKGIDVYIGTTAAPDYVRVTTDRSNGKYITLKKRYGNIAVQIERK